MKKQVFIFTILAMLICPCINATVFLFTQTTHPVSVTCMPMENLCCLKEGKSTSINILYLIEFGDAGIDTAAKCGCIRKVYYVNQYPKQAFYFSSKNLQLCFMGIRCTTYLS